MTRINPHENITTAFLYSQFHDINKKLSLSNKSNLNNSLKEGLENKVKQLVVDMNYFAYDERTPSLTEDQLFVFGMEINELRNHLDALDIHLDRQIKSLLAANNELIAHSELIKGVAKESFQQEKVDKRQPEPALRAGRMQKTVEQPITPEAKNSEAFKQLRSEFRELMYDSKLFPLQKAGYLKGLQTSLLKLQNQPDISPKLNQEIQEQLSLVQSELEKASPKSLLDLLKQIKENNDDYERINQDIDNLLLVKEIAGKETELGELRSELDNTSHVRIGKRRELKGRILEVENTLKRYQQIVKENQTEINNLRDVRLLLKPLILESSLKLLQSYPDKPIVGIEGEASKGNQTFFIIREAVNTEKSFNDALKIGLEIAKELKENNFLTPEQVALIPKMEEALLFSDGMLVKLNEAAQRDKDGNLTSVDLKKFAEIFDRTTLTQIYSAFAFMSEVQAMGEQIKELSDKQLENKDPRVFNIVQKGANAGDIRTEMTKYTIVMTQRLPRIEMLLKEIKKELKGEQAKAFDEQVLQPFVAITQALNPLNGR